MPRYTVVVVEKVITKYVTIIEVTDDEDDDTHDAVKNEAQRLFETGSLSTGDDTTEVEFEISAYVPPPVSEIVPDA